MPKKFFIETYGCTANKNDSEVMISLLQKEGYQMTAEKKADFIIINTCGVKATTENKIIDRLERLSKSGKKIIVAGCLTKINRNRIEKAIPDYAALVDTNSAGSIAKAINDAGKKNGVIRFSDKPGEFVIPEFSCNKTIRIISISQGCLSQCTFCGTKLARGNLMSYRPHMIREAVSRAVREGFKEIQLTSQDVSAYGRDIGTNIADLLGSLCKIKGDFFIRAGMMNPLHFRKFNIESLIKTFENGKIFKFLHIPVQSGSGKVLKHMRRGYSAGNFLEIARKFRKAFPELQLWTDIIVGYPAETDDDFEKSMELIKKTQPDFVNISKYSTRPGTEAAKLKKIRSEVVKERSREMTKLCKEVAKKRNEKWIGWKGRILINEYNEAFGNFIGRNYAYKPIVLQGFASGESGRLTSQEFAFGKSNTSMNLKLGDFANAKITGITEGGGSLIGILM